ncbi:MAG: hypothetical protein ACRD5K_08505 [Candidatus Acidiferrales bacterium]
MIPKRPGHATGAMLVILALSIPVRTTQERGRKKSQNEETIKKTKRTELAEEAGSLPAVMTQNPGDPKTLDLYYGAGGKEDAPDPNGTYTFVEEDLKQTSPKFDVVDARGTRWRVKLGAEPQAETAATRLLWASGYFVDEDYYVAEMKVRNLPKLHRGNEYVSAGGVVHGARLKRRPKDEKKIGAWNWFENPFVNTKDLEGLRVMMCLINNWDLNADNNSIYVIDGERRFLVSDVGASFGSTGNYFARSKSNLRGYAKAKFIADTNGSYVDFVMHSRPLFIDAIDVPNYRRRTRMEKVGKHIPEADAQMLGKRLSQLSDSQLRDCFRAAGYSPEQVDGYTRVVRKRIEELAGL